MFSDGLFPCFRLDACATHSAAEKAVCKPCKQVFRRPFALLKPNGLAAASAVGAAAAFAAVVLELQLGHHGGVGIVPALLGNVVFIIRHARHQAGGELGGFPNLGEFMPHFAPPAAACRRGTPPGFLWRSASRLCALSWRCARRTRPQRRPQTGTGR